MVPNLTEDPTPCFQDENIVVYGIPILAVNKKAFAPRNDPEDLSAKKNIAWRDRVIMLRRLGVMFPDKNTPRPSNHPFQYFHQQLPKLSGQIPLNLRPAMAYVAMASHPIRPKFDSEKGETTGVSPEEQETVKAIDTATVEGDPPRDPTVGFSIHPPRNS
jgi:hypothetical protein